MTHTQTCFAAINNALIAIDTLTSELTTQAINDPDILRDPPTVTVFRNAVRDTVIDFLTGPRMTELRGNAQTIDMTNALVSEVVFNVRADRNNPRARTDKAREDGHDDEAEWPGALMDDIKDMAKPASADEKPLGIRDALVRNAKKAVTTFGLRNMTNAMIEVCLEQRDRVTGREYLRFWKPRIAMLRKVASTDEFSDKHDDPTKPTIDETIRQHGYAVILDRLHTLCQHRRDLADSPETRKLWTHRLRGLAAVTRVTADHDIYSMLPYSQLVTSLKQLCSHNHDRAWKANALVAARRWTLRSETLATMFMNEVTDEPLSTEDDLDAISKVTARMAESREIGENAPKPNEPNAKNEPRGGR